LYQIDVYKDYLAIGGYTFDSLLAGPSNYGCYVAIHSISVSGKIYWAKVLKSKLDDIKGVQFSTDGALLIVHGDLSSFLAVINTINGNILSARKYSAGGFKNYNNLVKSMIVSSGASPMAYVLSNYETSSSCTGQHLFKFNPLTFSSTPDWIK
jgi:hypothetical protein